MAVASSCSARAPGISIFFSQGGRCGVQQNGLGFQVGGESFDAAFPPEPGLLEPAIGQPKIHSQPVLTDRPAADTPRDAIGRIGIVGEYRTIQSVIRVVRDPNCIFFILGRNKSSTGPKISSCAIRAFVLDVRKKRGLDKKAALSAGAAAASHKIGSELAVLDVRFDALELSFHGERAELRAGSSEYPIVIFFISSAIARASSSWRFREMSARLSIAQTCPLISAIVPVNNFAAASIGKVVPDDRGGFAAELERAARDTFAANARYAFPRRRRAGETHLVTPGLRTKCSLASRCAQARLRSGGNSRGFAASAMM